MPESIPLGEALDWTRPLESIKRSAGLCKLATDRPATPAWERHKPRRLAEVPPGLLDTFKKLVSGVEPWPLFISGPAGVGKSCAALALLDRTGGLYFTATGLCDELIRAQQGRLIGRSEEARLIFPENLWAEIGRTKLLVIDEIGSRDKVSDFSFDTLKRALDVREGKPLVAISNLELTRIVAVYDDRIASRLAAGTVVKLSGADRRLSRGNNP